MRAAVLLVLVLWLSGCERFTTEKRLLREAEVDWKNCLSVLRDQAERRQATNILPRISAFEKTMNEGLAEVRAAFAKGDSVIVSTTFARVTRVVDAECQASKRELEAWKKKSREARREAPFEIPAFLSERGATEAIELPEGYLELEDKLDGLIDLHRWVSFCKTTGGRLALTAPIGNTVLVRYRPGQDDLEEKTEEARARKVAFTQSQLGRVLEGLDLREADFAEIRLQPQGLGPPVYDVEVVEPCLEKPKKKP